MTQIFKNSKKKLNIKAQHPKGTQIKDTKSHTTRTRRSIRKQAPNINLATTTTHMKIAHKLPRKIANGNTAGEHTDNYYRMGVQLQVKAFARFIVSSRGFRGFHVSSKVPNVFRLAIILSLERGPRENSARFRFVSLIVDGGGFFASEDLSR